MIFHRARNYEGGYEDIIVQIRNLSWMLACPRLRTQIAMQVMAAINNLCVCLLYSGGPMACGCSYLRLKEITT